jgi:hypothetical protein
MRKYIILLPIVCFFFTGGCAEIAEPPSSSSTAAFTSQAGFTTTATQTVTSIPSNTATAISPSLTSTQTATQTPVPGVIRNCLEIQPVLPEVHTYSGRWILVTYPGLSYSLYDLNTKEIIPTEGDLPVAVSPDRSMYATVIFPSRQLKVFSADGKLTNTFGGRNWSHVNKWIDNHRVLIVTYVQETEQYQKYPQDYVYLDLATGETQILLSNYPGIDKASYTLNWSDSGTTSYDPTLTRVIYPGGIDYENYGYVLFNIPENTIINNLTAGNFGVEPIWSPDGSKVALWLEKMNRATDKIVSITLAVLDIASGIITDTCIPAGFNPERLFYFSEPVWSPDGNSLVVDTNYREEDKSNEVVMVDLQKQAAYKVLENYYPLGWLVAP